MADDPKKPKPFGHSDAVSVGDGFTAVVTHGEAVKAVRTQGTGEHAVAADVSEQQDIILRLSGSPSHGEESVRGVIYDAQVAALGVEAARQSRRFR